MLKELYWVFKAPENSGPTPGSLVVNVAKRQYQRGQQQQQQPPKQEKMLTTDSLLASALWSEPESRVLLSVSL